MEYVQAHRDIWKVLLTGGAASTMREEFIRVSEEIAHTERRINPWLPSDLGPSFVTSGIFEIFAWWMCQEKYYPLDNVVKLFNFLIIENFANPSDIKITKNVKLRHVESKSFGCVNPFFASVNS